jgi:hypothetical protein
VSVTRHVWRGATRVDGSGLAGLGLLSIGAAAKLPTLSQPLTENFAWRQTQTAWTALIYHQEGIDLFHPQVPVHGPPWTFGFEFPLFQTMGALLMEVGLEPDLAMRTLGLITFLLTGWLLFRLAGRLARPAAAIATLTAFLFSPFGLLWGRTSLIEYLATACSLAFLLAGMRWLDNRRPADLGLAFTAGALSMLVKITTGVFYLVPLLAYRPGGRAAFGREWSGPALVAVSSAIGLLWVRHIDALKAASPATAFQTSAQMIYFNFGTPEMRLDPVVLAPIGAALLVGLTGAGLLAWLPMAIAYLRTLPQRWFVVVLLASTIVGAPLALTPLYSTQNYYPAAISPAVALLVGLGAAWGWERRRELAGRVGLVAGIGLWIVTILLTRDYWTMSYQPVVDRDGSLDAAAFVRERTEPGDWVVIKGRGWDPTILYYAGRRGYMIDARRDDSRTIAELRADGRYDLFVSCPYEGSCEPIAE